MLHFVSISRVEASACFSLADGVKKGQSKGRENAKTKKKIRICK